jgi:hypothetical protein
LDGSHHEKNEEAATAEETSSESLQALSDKTRDATVSMRAGSEAIPVEALKLENEHMSDPRVSAKFNFATSNQNEPVRTYDPDQDYSGANASARASAPASDMELKRHDKNGSTDVSRPTRSAQSENTTSTALRGAGGEENGLTPSQSTAATSYTSESREEPQRNQNSFQAMRNRAASAPIRSPSPDLGPSFSMGSNSGTSRDSSKVDFRTTVLSNGDTTEGSARDHRNKINSKSMGRKRSKLRLGLAFWKRNRSEKSIDEGRRPESQGSATEGC